MAKEVGKTMEPYNSMGQNQAPTPAGTQQLPASQPPKKRMPKWFVALVTTVVLASIIGVTIAWFYSRESDELLMATGEPAIVSIEADGLNPTTIKVRPNQSITWYNNNDTGTSHTLVSINHPDLFGEGERLENGDSFSYAFAEPGTYHYNDKESPSGISGTVIVE